MKKKIWWLLSLAVTLAIVGLKLNEGAVGKALRNFQRMKAHDERMKDLMRRGGN